MTRMTNWLQTATVFDWLTNVSAFLAVALLILVIYGFRRYTIRPRTEPIDYMGTGIWVLALFNGLRLFWWDVLPDITGHNWEHFGLDGTSVDWAFNVPTIVGAWYMLKGFHMLVEERSPGRYNILTAVFYPRQIRLIFVTKPKGD